jgi:hypothetical protein
MLVLLFFASYFIFLRQKYWLFKAPFQGDCSEEKTWLADIRFTWTLFLRIYKDHNLLQRFGSFLIRSSWPPLERPQKHNFCRFPFDRLFWLYK